MFHKMIWWRCGAARRALVHRCSCGEQAPHTPQTRVTSRVVLSEQIAAVSEVVGSSVVSGLAGCVGWQRGLGIAHPCSSTRRIDLDLGIDCVSCQVSVCEQICTIAADAAGVGVYGG